MSILSVDNIQPIGSGTSVTVNSAATLVLTNANSTGVITATSFVGNLTGNVTGTASANAVLTGSTNNTLVTVTGANAITGEANLTFDGNDLTVTGTAPAINFIDTDADDYKIHNVQGVLKITDTTASADRFVINDNGTGYFLSNFQIGSTTSSPGATLHINTSYPSLKVDSGGHASDAYVRIISGNAQNSRVDFGDSDDDNIGIIDYDHANNSMSFTTNTTERLRITSDGSTQIASGVLQRRYESSNTAGYRYYSKADRFQIAHGGSGTNLTITGMNQGWASIRFGGYTEGNRVNFRADIGGYNAGNAGVRLYDSNEITNQASNYAGGSTCNITVTKNNASYVVNITQTNNQSATMASFYYFETGGYNSVSTLTIS